LGCEIKARMFFPKNFLVILTYKILAKNQHSVFAPATWHGGIVSAYVIESYGPWDRSPHVFFPKLSGRSDGIQKYFRPSIPPRLWHFQKSCHMRSSKKMLNFYKAKKFQGHCKKKILCVAFFGLDWICSGILKLSMRAFTYNVSDW
jgi:hypothetical protein